VADINHIITLGIGTPADIPHFVLVGLSVNPNPIIIEAEADVTVIVGEKAQTIVVNETLGVTVR
jgi:hypothetical protein